MVAGGGGVPGRRGPQTCSLEWLPQHSRRTVLALSQKQLGRLRAQNCKIRTGGVAWRACARACAKNFMRSACSCP